MPVKKPEQGFSAEERDAMREAIKERRRAKSSPSGDGESDVRAKIAEMPQPDRQLAERFHAIVKATAPGLVPRTWYGMPAYSKGDDVLCWFQPASKFKARYSFIGFSDSAQLDDGRMWPISYAVTTLTAAEEARIANLVKQAVGGS